MKAGSRPRQSGQTLVMFALTLAFAFVGLIALVGDAAVMLYQYNQANSAALLGAQAGAAAVDLDAFYQGSLTLDAGAAKDSCEKTAEQFPGVTASCDVTPDRRHVTASVTKTVSMPVPIWGTAFTFQVTRTGEAVFGGQVPCTTQPCP